MSNAPTNPHGDPQQQERAGHPSKRGVRYLKQFQLVETDIELPIQGRVEDPEDLYTFMKELQDDTISKVIGVYLDTQHVFIGHQVFLDKQAEDFKHDTSALWRYHVVFGAKKLIVLVNHPSGDSLPTDADRTLITKLVADSNILSFASQFIDYIIVGDQEYFSLTTNTGEVSHGGHQTFAPGLDPGLIS